MPRPRDVMIIIYVRLRVGKAWNGIVTVRKGSTPCCFHSTISLLIREHWEWCQGHIVCLFQEWGTATLLITITAGLSSPPVPLPLHFHFNFLFYLLLYCEVFNISHLLAHHHHHLHYYYHPLVWIFGMLIERVNRLSTMPALSTATSFPTPVINGDGCVGAF